MSRTPTTSLIYIDSSYSPSSDPFSPRTTSLLQCIRPAGLEGVPEKFKKAVRTAAYNKLGAPATPTCRPTPGDILFFDGGNAVVEKGQAIALGIGDTRAARYTHVAIVIPDQKGQLILAEFGGAGVPHLRQAPIREYETGLIFRAIDKTISQKIAEFANATSFTEDGLENKETNFAHFRAGLSPITTFFSTHFKTSFTQPTLTLGRYKAISSGAPGLKKENGSEYYGWCSRFVKDIVLSAFIRAPTPEGEQEMVTQETINGLATALFGDVCPRYINPKELVTLLSKNVFFTNVASWVSVTNTFIPRPSGQSSRFFKPARDEKNNHIDPFITTIKKVARSASDDAAITKITEFLSANKAKMDYSDVILFLAQNTYIPAVDYALTALLGEYPIQDNTQVAAQDYTEEYSPSSPEMGS